MRKGLLLLSISSFFYLATGYVTNIFLGRFLGPSDYGIYGILISMIGIVNILQSNGIPMACSKFLSENQKESDQIFNSSFYLQLTITIIITSIFYLFASPFSQLIGDPYLESYIKLMSITLPFYSIFSLYIGYYNGLHLFREQSIITIIYSFTKILLIIGLGLIFYLKGALWGFVLSPLIPILFTHKFPSRIKAHFPYRKLIKFSIPIIIFSIVTYLQQNIDLYFVKGIMHLNEATGYYTANQNISKVAFFALSGFSGVFFPIISKNVSLNLHEENRKVIHQGLRVVFLFLIPFSFFISGASSQILELLYSELYLPSASSLSILIFGISFLTVFTILANILSGSGKPILAVWLALIGLFVTSVSCILFIPEFGLSGAALSTTIGAFSSMCIAAIMVYKHFNALINHIRVIKIIFASLCMYYLTSLIPFSPKLLPLMAGILFIFYFGLLLILKEITKNDLLYAKNFIPHKYRTKIFKS